MGALDAALVGGFLRVAGTDPLSARSCRIVEWIIPAIQTVHILCIGAVISAALALTLRQFGLLAADQPLARASVRVPPRHLDSTAHPVGYRQSPRHRRADPLAGKSRLSAEDGSVGLRHRPADRLPTDVSPASAPPAPLPPPRDLARSWRLPRCSCGFALSSPAAGSPTRGKITHVT